MNKWAELLIGLVILLGIILFAWFSPSLGTFWDFKHAAWEFVKVGFIWFVIGIGLIFIVLGLNDLRSD